MPLTLPLCNDAFVPYQAFEASLKRLGLSDREAAVYLALLSMGPSSVLQISRKSGVPRATTYLTLERLAHLGLVTTYERNNSQWYVGEEPQHLRYLLQSRREELDKEAELLKDLVPKLQAFIWSEDSRPTVRYYHGREGLRTMRSEMLRISSAGDTWFNFTPMDYLLKVFGEEDYTYDRQRLARRIRSKTIFTTRSAALKKKVLAVPDTKRIQRKFVSPDKFSSGAGVSIFGNRVAVGSMDKHPGGFIVESESVATLMREMFDLVWESLDSN